ncbi:MAG: hypothetical protein KDD70_15600 [Bdellovibrionales bacterium]|nr:hypothetical protein [Bdellovibrionales bacterium]
MTLETGNENPLGRDNMGRPNQAARDEDRHKPPVQEEFSPQPEAKTFAELQPPCIHATSPQTPIQPRQKGKAVVTEPEFRRIQSLEELRELYRSRGLTFSSTEGLIEQVKQDWEKDRVRYLTEAAEKELPEEFPKLTVDLNGKSHNIYGCIHSPGIGEELFKLLATTVLSKPFWVHEHNLGREFLPGIPSLEIDDHNARGVPLRMLRELGKIWSSLLSLQLPQLIPRNVQEINRRSEQDFGDPHKTFKIYTMAPFDGPMELPSHIDIMRREELDLGYNQYQLRSAYQAAFFKAWDPPKALKVTDEQKKQSRFAPETWEEKNILVGAGHAHDIEYFLTHEPKYGVRACERARVDAELFNENPEAYLRRVRIRNGIALTGGFAAATASGAAAGYLARILLTGLFS